MKKTVLAILLTFLIMNGFCLDIYAVSAASSCVLDVETGKVLHENRAHVRLGMASTTKIMTALLAIESERLDEVVTVSRAAACTEGSSLYLKAEEKLLLLDLVYGLMLNSGNDAAVAIAEHISGDITTFVELMNKKAKEIGAVNTNFVNPNGLSDEMHYTTAYDLALISSYALKNPEFSKIVATKSKTIVTADTKRKIYLHNHNKLLDSLENCDGVKTGFTKATGRCLVSSVTGDDFRTVCVTLNAPDDWRDHTLLHNAAFEKYENKLLLKYGEIVGKVSVEGGTEAYVNAIAGNSVFGLFEKESAPKIILKADIRQNLRAPVSKGTCLGKVYVYVDGKCIDETEIVSERNIEATAVRKFGDLFVALIREVFCI